MWKRIMPDLPSGTVTFLFTDIEGSTALWKRDRQAMVVTTSTPAAQLQAPQVAGVAAGTLVHRGHKDKSITIDPLMRTFR
jgi:class 3 adenylate cyclase